MLDILICVCRKERTPSSKPGADLVFTLVLSIGYVCVKLHAIPPRRCLPQHRIFWNQIECWTTIAARAASRKLVAITRRSASTFHSSKMEANELQQAAKDQVAGKNHKKAKSAPLLLTGQITLALTMLSAAAAVTVVALFFATSFAHTKAGFSVKKWLFQLGLTAWQ